MLAIRELLLSSCMHIYMLQRIICKIRNAEHDLGCFHINFSLVCVSLHYTYHQELAHPAKQPPHLHPSCHQPNKQMLCSESVQTCLQNFRIIRKYQKLKYWWGSWVIVVAQSRKQRSKLVQIKENDDVCMIFNTNFYLCLTLGHTY